MGPKKAPKAQEIPDAEKAKQQLGKAMPKPSKLQAKSKSEKQPDINEGKLEEQKTHFESLMDNINAHHESYYHPEMVAKVRDAYVEYHNALDTGNQDLANQWYTYALDTWDDYSEK